MIIQRLFSIQSGEPEKGGSLKRELTNKITRGAIQGGLTGGIGSTGLLLTSAALGGIKNTDDGIGALRLGATLTIGSAILGAILDAFTALDADSKRAKAKGLTMKKFLDNLYNIDNVYSEAKSSEYVNLKKYIIEDGDPNKFMVNFAYKDGKLVINLNNPSDKIIRDFNEYLEELVKYNRKADYTAKQIKNGFMVYVVCPDIDSAACLIYNIVAENKIKVNALTEKSL